MSVYLIAANNPKHELEEDEHEDSGRAKKKVKEPKDKDKFKDLGQMVKNNQAVQEWIMPGFKYKAIFTKETIGATPPFNDTGLITCNKWHVRGFCYEKCDRRNSHKKFESAAHKTTYDTWIKLLKSQNS